MTPEAERRLSAILHADVAGFSRLMSEDEPGTIGSVTHYREQVAVIARRHRGRLVDSAGDSFLVEFPTATGALQTAIEIQLMAATRNADLAPERRMQLRVGIHLGEVRAEAERIYGDGVNIAARLQSLCVPGGICVSGAVHEQVRSRLDLGFEDLGEQSVKNIPYPVRVFRVLGALAEVPGRPAPPATAADPGSSLPASPEISIAVLSFDDLTPDPEGVAYGDILATEIINSLARPHGLRVASRLSSFAYRGRAVDPRVIGRELGVGYVLAGSVRRRGDRARVMAEITDTQTASQLWTHTWEAPAAELLEVPEEMAEAIVAVFYGEYVRAEVRRASETPEEALDARGLIQKARTWFLHYSEAGLLEALDLTQRALIMKPDYAVAQATLALVSIELSINGWGGSRKQNELVACQAADRSVAMRPNHPICLENYGLVWLHCGEWERSVQALRRAVEIAPTDLIAWAHLGFALGIGSADEADVREGDAILERIYRTAPEHPLAGFWLVFRSASLTRQGRYGEASSAVGKGAEAQPEFAFGWLALANSLALGGRMTEARSALARAHGVNPGLTPPIYAAQLHRCACSAEAAEPNVAGLRELGVL